jgi:hypothetical protein
MAVIDDNLAGLRDRVRRWLHELNDDTSFWGNTFIDQMINVSYRRRCGQLVMAYEGYFTNVATRDLTADQSRYSWPPGFERCLRVELVRSDGTQVPIERYERHYGANFVNNGADGDVYRPTFRPISGGFVLEPTPSSTVVDGVRMEYFGLPTLMQNDGDSMHADFPRTLDELVVLDSVVACMDSENLQEGGTIRAATRMRAEYEQDFERYIDNKVIGTNKIMPFAPHYTDA